MGHGPRQDKLKYDVNGNGSIKPQSTGNRKQFATCVWFRRFHPRREIRDFYGLKMLLFLLFAIDNLQVNSVVYGGTFFMSRPRVWLITRWWWWWTRNTRTDEFQMKIKQSKLGHSWAVLLLQAKQLKRKDSGNSNIYR